MRVAAFVLVLLGCAAPAHAQERLLSDAARVSLLTALPGDAVHALYGHSALRVYDPERDIDLSFNYGTFDFDAWFVPRFVYGELDYFLSHYPFALGVESYRREGRPVIEQVLNLSAAQREAVFRFLALNARPENRYYRYDFLFDNCSTRIRDLFETTLGGALRFPALPDTGRTFRALIDPYQGVFLDTGIDLLLGAPVDRTALPREMMFLPDHLMAAFDAAVVDTGAADTGAAAVPLVARTDTVLWIDGYRRPAAGLPWVSVLLWAAFALGAAVTYRDYRAGRVVRRVVDVPLFAVTGVLGVLIVFLWFVSLHEVTARNWNLLWAWPTHLAAAWLLLRGRTPGAWLRRYTGAAAVAALAFALGWFAWPQHLPPALLPLLLLLALRGARLAAGERHIVRPPSGRPVTAAEG